MGERLPLPKFLNLKIVVIIEIPFGWKSCEEFFAYLGYQIPSPVTI
jgi:hypothetical protein